MSKTSSEKYISLNALTKFKDEDGKYHFQSDKEAVQEYIKTQICVCCLILSKSILHMVSSEIPILICCFFSCADNVR